MRLHSGIFRATVLIFYPGTFLVPQQVRQSTNQSSMAYALGRKKTNCSRNDHQAAIAHCVNDDKDDEEANNNKNMTKRATIREKKNMVNIIKTLLSSFQFSCSRTLSLWGAGMRPAFASAETEHKHTHAHFQIFTETTSHSALCSHINVPRSAGAMRSESSIFFRFACYEDMTVIVISYYFLSSIVRFILLFRSVEAFVSFPLSSFRGVLSPSKSHALAFLAIRCTNIFR